MPKLFLCMVFSLCIVLLIGMNAYSEESRPCSEEIAKFCKEVKPGGGHVISCLKEHDKELSTTCREKIREMGERLEECQKACCDDVKKLCGGIKPGMGRIAKCLKKHSAELSASCKDKIGAKYEE